MPRTQRATFLRPPCPVVLLTDFGPHSAYVGQMKLAIERAAPGTPVIDLAHDLPPQDLLAAALVLKGAWRFLPAPSVLCVVVDPEVGSPRRVLAARYSSGITVLAPDNGLLRVLGSGEGMCELRAVTNAQLRHDPISPVFHGRDLFAPVAARLAAGLPLARVGPRAHFDSKRPAPWPAVRKRGQTWTGQVLFADRFGNLITNLEAAELAALRDPHVRCAKRSVPWRTHYAQVPRGRPLALLGSYGFLEVAVREGSAARMLRAGPGARVTVRDEGRPHRASKQTRRTS